LAHGVLSHRQRPADQKNHKDQVTRGAEASHESDLVNPKRMWYFCSSWRSSFPHVCFQNTGSSGTPSFSTIIPINQQVLIQKGRNYR
jgi:hypothetical protein